MSICLDLYKCLIRLDKIVYFCQLMKFGQILTIFTVLSRQGYLDKTRQSCRHFVNSSLQGLDKTFCRLCLVLSSVYSWQKCCILSRAVPNLVKNYLQVIHRFFQNRTKLEQGWEGVGGVVSLFILLLKNFYQKLSVWTGL